MSELGATVLVMDFLAHIGTESALFVAALRECDPAARVPTCPDWTAADLLWHLGEVQHFWATIVRERRDSPPETEPDRPSEYADLLAFFDAYQDLLVAALADAADDVPVWTWTSDPAHHTVGFIRRRQAHEALIHRLDAEATVGTASGVDAELAEDGVDEVLRVMFGNHPAWATWSPSGPVGRVRVEESGREWTFRVGGLSGTQPRTGTEYTDEPGILLLDNDPDATPTFTVSGASTDLDAWLWNRPHRTEPTVEGSDPDYRSFVAVVTSGVS